MGAPIMKRLAAALAAIAIAGPALAADTEPTFTIVIKEHRFDPAVVEVPAGKKFRLLVKNQDPTPEEFESKELRREKVIKGNSEAVINLGPLKAGTYPFVGEFNEKTAQGRLVAR